ncbi:MAG: hypothetical protein IPG71_13550 [bacterium]|nr:hypothetical protein [bacterium]
MMRAALWLRALFGAAMLIAVGYMIVPPWGEQADIWETAAAIQAISDSPLDPRNPLLDLPGDTSPRFTPYTIVAGVVDRLFALELFTTVGMAGVFSLMLFVTGIARVIRTLTPGPRAVLWCIPVMLLGWGHGYGEANSYHFEFFFATLPYVGALTYGICFHGLAELDRYLTQGSRGGLIAYAALAVLAFLTHPITALLLFVAAFAWAVVRASWRTAIALQLVPLLSLGAAFLWPYFDYPTLLFRGSTEAWYKVRLFDDQLTKVGPALLGIPVAAYFALRKRYPELVVALGCSIFVYAASWTLDIQIGSRFIFYGSLFSHLCLGLFFFESGVFRRGVWNRPLLQTGVVVFLILAVLGVGGYYRARKLVIQWTPAVEHYRETKGDLLEPWEDIRFTRDYLDEHSVVMVEDTVGWRIPAVSKARLVAQAKGDPLIAEEVVIRRADANRFFYGPLESVERWELLQKYHCTHILLDERHALRFEHSLRSDLDVMASLAYARPPYRLYRVKPTE